MGEEMGQNCRLVHRKQLDFVEGGFEEESPWSTNKNALYKRVFFYGHRHAVCNVLCM